MGVGREFGTHGDGRDGEEVGEGAGLEVARGLGLEDALVGGVQEDPVEGVQQLRLRAAQVEACLLPAM